MGLLHTIPLINTMGNIWNFTKYVAIPYECSAIIYGITMGLTHTIPIPDAMGDVWNFTKYVEIP